MKLKVMTTGVKWTCRECDIENGCACTQNINGYKNSDHILYIPQKENIFTWLMSFSHQLCVYEIHIYMLIVNEIKIYDALDK